jgi:hypothetical protein
MWKLTIEQQKKSVTSDYAYTVKVEFVSDELSELTMLVERLAHCEEVYETTYKIEKVGDK